MPLPDTTFWTNRLNQALHGYSEQLLRRVAGKLCRNRNHWPNEELIDRCLTLVGNPAGLDRRLKDLDPSSRRLLALMAHSRQPRWAVGNLIEILLALGEPDGLQPILALLEAGLLYPDGHASNGSLKDFQLWLGHGQSEQLVVFAHPEVSRRLLGENLNLPSCPEATSLSESRLAVHQADGLEWPLRLAVLWQQVAAAPLRQTQQGEFFKRDLDRLRHDPLLSGASVDSLIEIPDLAPLAVALALAEGLLRDQEGELHAGNFPAVWQASLADTLASLWVAILQMASWNCEQGWCPGQNIGNPYPSAYFLSLLLLSQLPDKAWAQPQAVEKAVFANHPYWGAVAGRTKPSKSVSKPTDSVLTRFLLGLAHQLGLVQAARLAKDTYGVRLSPLGRWVLGFGPLPPGPPPLQQALLVQPNLEILAYRQGLTPELIVRLGRFATWKGLSTACTLQLQPEMAYRALEGGETFESLVQTLERHGMKALPVPVLESLRTWANKHERIQVYPSAALFEFASPADLAEALTRGLPAVRLTERLAVVANEQAVDFRHFRLTGTRDYTLPPEKCVTLDADGITLRVDVAKSDLLLETELPRFAELMPQQPADGRRLYRLTPATLASARNHGWSLAALETWISQRSGTSLAPAARLLYQAGEIGSLPLQHLLVLQVPTVELADGILQWPQTRSFIHDRLGPTALVITAEQVEPLRKSLDQLGIALQEEGKS